MGESDRVTGVTPVSRRAFVKGSTVGLGAVAVGGAASNPAAAQTVENPWEDYSITDAAKDALTAGNVVAIGYDYLMGTDYVDEARTRLANHAHRSFGDMRDYSGYTGADALYQELEVGTVEMKQSDEKVFASLNNHIEAADNVAYAKGQVAIAEALNSDKTESEANDEMTKVIDDYFSKIQMNIMNHLSTQLEQLHHHIQQAEAHADLSAGDIFDGQSWDNSVSDSAELYPVNVDLLNGDAVEINILQWERSSDTETHGLPGAWFEGGYDITGSEVYTPDNYLTTSDDISHLLKQDSWMALVPQGDSYSNADYSIFSENTNQHYTPYHFEAWDNVIQTRDSVLSDLSGYVTDVYAAYEPGEVSVEDIVDPITFATELSTDNNRGFRQAAASSLGIPTNAEENVVITIHFSEEDGGDTKVWTDLYTAHQPTDENGDPTGWTVGETYSPSEWDDPLMIVYEDDEGNADMAQLEEDFTIDQAYDGEGNEIGSFDNESTMTHTSDVEQFEDQLKQLREEQQRLLTKWEDQESEDPGGAGGGWFQSDGKTLGLAALGAAVVALLLSDSGDS